MNKLSKPSGSAGEETSPDQERIRKDCLIQFRASAEMVEQLKQIAQHRMLPVGALVRSWVADELRRSILDTPLPELELPDGRTVSRDSDLSQIEELQRESDRGELHLGRRERATIAAWLPRTQTSVVSEPCMG